MEFTQEDLKKLQNSLNEMLETTDDGTQDLFKSILGLLALPDEQFVILAPGIMQSYQQLLNNPSDKLGLVQAINATGTKVEDAIEGLRAIEPEIDNLPITAPKRDFLKELILSIGNSIIDVEGIAKRLIEVPIEICREEAKLPEYAHISDSGMDVFAIEDIVIHPGETVLAKTGIKVALPTGFELQVRPKSGRSLKSKLRISNAPGTVDQGYRDEIGIILENIEPAIKDITYKFGENGEIIIDSILHGSDITIGKGEKICQLVLAEVPKVAWTTVNSVQDIGEDRGGGFGSSGLK